MNNQPESIYIPPTAWQSIPSFIRFAAWVWAVALVVGLTVGLVVYLAFLISLG